MFSHFWSKNENFNPVFFVHFLGNPGLLHEREEGRKVESINSIVERKGRERPLQFLVDTKEQEEDFFFSSRFVTLKGPDFPRKIMEVGFFF